MRQPPRPGLRTIAGSTARAHGNRATRPAPCRNDPSRGFFSTALSLSSTGCSTTPSPPLLTHKRSRESGCASRCAARAAWSTATSSSAWRPRRSSVRSPSWTRSCLPCGCFPPRCTRSRAGSPIAPRDRHPMFCAWSFPSAWCVPRRHGVRPTRPRDQRSTRRRRRRPRARSTRSPRSGRGSSPVSVSRWTLHPGSPPRRAASPSARGRCFSPRPPRSRSPPGVQR